jgi:hypothetical protein
MKGRKGVAAVCIDGPVGEQLQTNWLRNPSSADEIAVQRSNNLYSCNWFLSFVRPQYRHTTTIYHQAQRSRSHIMAGTTKLFTILHHLILIFIPKFGLISYCLGRNSCLPSSIDLYTMLISFFLVAFSLGPKSQQSPTDHMASHSRRQ